MPNDDRRVWNSNLLKKITFKIGTGAEVTAISKETWLTLDEPELNSSNKLLYGPAKKPLKSTGHFYCDISHKGRISQQQIFVVDDLKTNDSSNYWPTLSNQNRCCVDRNPWKQILVPIVFNGLGKLSGVIPSWCNTTCYFLSQTHSSAIASTSCRWAQPHGKGWSYF